MKNDRRFDQIRSRNRRENLVGIIDVDGSVAWVGVGDRALFGGGGLGFEVERRDGGDGGRRGGVEAAEEGRERVEKLWVDATGGHDRRTLVVKRALWR